MRRAPGLQRFVEPVLRRIHGAQHPASQVTVGGGNRALQHGFREPRQRRIADDSSLPHRHIGQAYRCLVVGGMGRHAGCRLARACARPSRLVVDVDATEPL